MIAPCASRKRSLTPLVFARQATFVAWLAVLGAVLAAPPAALHADEVELAAEEDEDNPFRPGLIARYTGADGASHVRLEASLSHVWLDRAPDRRVPPGPFSATFAGRLWTQSPGEYRLHVYAAGSVRLTLGEEVLLDAHLAEPGWLAAEPVELPFGFHPLTVEYRRADEPARIAMYWEGPLFGFEPVSERWLLHDREQTPAQAFERGEQLVRGLRCAACHSMPGEDCAARGRGARPPGRQPLARLARRTAGRRGSRQPVASHAPFCFRSPPGRGDRRRLAIRL